MSIMPSWSCKVNNASVSIWRDDSAPLSYIRKPDSNGQKELAWLYEIAAMYITDIIDPVELRCFLDMIKRVSDKLVPP